MAMKVRWFVLEGPVESEAKPLEELFSGAAVVVDGPFRELLEGVGPRYRLEDPAHFEVWNEYLDLEGRTTYLQPSLMMDDLNGHMACALLAYLAKDGKDVLRIPGGYEEINVVLGYKVVDGRKLMFYVEHELERGREEYHLHARPVGRLRAVTVRVLVRV